MARYGTFSLFVSCLALGAASVLGACSGAGDILADRSAATTPATLYLHGGGSAGHYMDGNAPLPGPSQSVHSGPLSWNSGNAYQIIEVSNFTSFDSITATEGFATAALALGSADPDSGTHYDLLVELLKNGEPIGAGELLNHPISYRKGEKSNGQTTVSICIWRSESFNPGDLLSIRISTRLGSDGAGHPGGGNPVSAGLALYFDSARDPSSLQMQLQ